MELIWYFIIIGMLVMYFILDGYDFGAGIVQLFFAKGEEEKEVVYKAIGPFWDANEVWLVAAGGTLFCAFPLLYASSFSGFYLPLIMVLWFFIFRGISIELREQINNPLWHAFWDKAFGIASLLLALFFGVALGNVIRGVNLGMVDEGKLTQEENFFSLPLWNEEFSPTHVFPGVLDWFTVIIGVIAVVTLAIHGANWIIYKTDSTLKTKMKKAVPKLAVLLGALVILSFVLLPIIKENPLHNFMESPWLFILPAIALVGYIGLFFVNKFKGDGKGFVFSTLFIIGGLGSSMASIFPAFLPSTNTSNPSLTLYNTVADEYGLNIAIVWFCIAFVLVIFYFIVQYKIFRGKQDTLDYH